MLIKYAANITNCNDMTATGSLVCHGPTTDPTSSSTQTSATNATGQRSQIQSSEYPSHSVHTPHLCRPTLVVAVIATG